MKDRKIEYKGYTVTQAYNGHVMISKDGKMCFHSNMKGSCTDNELKQMVEHYESFMKHFDEFWEKKK